MKKYQIDWVQFICALITVVSLVGAIVAMFIFLRQPWPVVFPLLCVAALFSVIVDARMEGHGRRGRK
jgi:peptidoglycan/LPS O-acetylase OafA/YrhL